MSAERLVRSGRVLAAVAGEEWSDPPEYLRFPFCDW